MQLIRQSARRLLSRYNIKSQKKLLRIMTQVCGEIQMGQTIVELENAHVHPHGINRSLNRHQHHFLEVHVPYSGAGFVEANGNKSYFHLGEFTVNAPGQLHYWEMTQAPLAMLIFWLHLKQKAENPAPVDRLLINLFETRSVVHPLPQNFFFLCEEIFTEAASPRVGIEHALKNWLMQIVLSLARATAKPGVLGQKMSIEPKGRNERIIFMVDQFLERNLSSKLQLRDIARHVSLSPRSLTRSYRDIKGESLWEELNRLRMVRAEELLRETDLPIKAVAGECGFTDQRYFTRRFREFYRSTPGDYRQQIVPS